MMSPLVSPVMPSDDLLSQHMKHSREGVGSMESVQNVRWHRFVLCSRCSVHVLKIHSSHYISMFIPPDYKQDFKGFLKEHKKKLI